LHKGGILLGIYYYLELLSLQFSMRKVRVNVMKFLYLRRTLLSFRRNIIILSATFLLLFFGAVGHAFENGLVLYYRFDEAKGDTAYDLSGNNNNGNINKTEWINGGKFGSALMFNGNVDNYVRIKNSKSLIPENQVTLEAWVYPTKVAGFNNIISNTEAAGHNIRFENNKLISYIHIAGGYAIPTGGPDIVPEKWYHTAVTYDGKVAKLYLDGQLIGEAPRDGKITESTQDIFIGSETDANQPNVAYAFFGIIDEVRIWHIARTPEAILRGMEKPLMVSPNDHLTTCWGEIKKK
jgi:hypothetical protein